MAIMTPITPDMPYRQIGTVPLSTYEREFARVNSILLPHAAEMHAAAGLHSALALGQMWLENQYATTGEIIQPEDNNPLSLRPWIEDPRASVVGPVLDWQTRKSVALIRVPPGAVGAIRDRKGGLMLRFATPADCIREWRRRIIDDRSYKGGVYNKAVTLRQMLDIYAPPKDVHPETGKDNADISYPETVVKMLKRYAAMESTAPETPAEEPKPMPTYSTVIPGVPGGPLTTSFPVHLKIVPPHLTHCRPGIKAKLPRQSNQHETANLNTYAAGDAAYLFGGSGGRQASWHITVDHMEAFIGIPLDEVTWQAGDGSGKGNMNGISCELAVHRNILANAATLRLSRRNAAEIMGKIGARLNAVPPARQHNFFSGKDCPHYLRAHGAWNQYVEDYMYFYNMEKAAMQGKPTPNNPAPDTGVINIGDTIRALVDLNVRQSATVKATILKTVPVGTDMVVNGRWSSADGYGWLPVAVGSVSGFVAMGDDTEPFIQKIKSAPKPQDPPKPKPYADRLPVPELLMTDLQKYDTAPGIRTDDKGQDFVFVADVIEFIKPTPAYRHGGKGSPEVKAGYTAGDRAIAAWLVETADNGWFYILAGGDDEWVRVPYNNTVRVSDAPLLKKDTVE